MADRKVIQFTGTDGNEYDVRDEAAQQKIGTTALPTTAQTLTGAIAEHESDITNQTAEVNSLKSAFYSVRPIAVGKKNLFNLTEMLGTDGVSAGNGTEFYGKPSAMYNFGNLAVLNGFPAKQQFTVSLYAYNANATGTNNGLTVIVGYTDSTEEYLITFSRGQSEYTKKTGTTNSEKTVSYIKIGYRTGGNDVWYIKELQIETGTEATSYAAFDPTAIDFEARKDVDDIDTVIGFDGITDVSGTISNGLCDARTGEIDTSTSSYKVTDYITVDDGYAYFYSGRIYAYAGIAGYDSNKDFVQPILMLDSGHKDYSDKILIIPNSVKYIIATSQANISNPVIKKAKTNLSDIIAYADNIKTALDSTTAELNQLEDNIDKSFYTTISMFERVGVCGDSFSSGGIYDVTGVEDGRHMSVSWTTVLGRYCGVDCASYSEPGINARNYFSNENCMPALLAGEKCGLYIIALGINTETPTGTVADINDSDYTQNADTFCGNLAKVYQMIREFSPKSKFIFYRMPAISGTSGRSEAIAAVAEHFSVPCILYSENDYGFFESDFYRNNRSTSHPIAPTYAGMARVIEHQIAVCIMNNVSYFRDYDGTVNDN